MVDVIRIPIEVPAKVKEDEAPTELSVRINQIFNQKGAFRNVTEESIAQDPDSDYEDFKAEESTADEHGKAETADQRLERLFKERDEMLGQITQGAIQINSALDFVSMLLSQHSKIAQGTFSDALKAAVKPGMFDGHVLPEGHIESNVKSTNELSTGWRWQSYNAASNSLQSASKRLREQADRESSFWHQVADINQKGWKLSRHPRNSRATGAHFGLSESAPQFRQQGFALLRQDSGSSVYLDLPKTQSRKRLSVQMLREDRVTGQHTQMAAKVHSAVEQQLTDARDRSIDEELFHELGREARLAANQGIVTRDEHIEMDIAGNSRVRFTFRSPKSGFEHEGIRTDDDLARYIRLSMRSLLLHAHKENYVRRTRAPPPISLRTASRPEYAILRPILAALRHRIAVAGLRHQIDTAITDPLVAAQLSVGISVDDNQKEDSNSDDPHSFVESSPQISKFVIQLPSTKAATITVQTYLGRPTYGTSYAVSAVDYDHSSFHAYRCDNPESLLDALSRLTLLDLMEVMYTSTRTNTGAETPHWVAGQSHRGELHLVSGQKRQPRYTARVGLEADVLLLQVRRQSRQSNEANKPLLWSWGSGRAATNGQPGDIGLSEDVTADVGFEKAVKAIANATMST